jgi:putative Mg2+ transporter-C (MgtC) family protein
MISFPLVALRLGAALLLGALLGLEREHREHAAGLKTLALVSLGAALMTVVSAYGFESLLGYSPNVRLDPTRIAAQIVSGIGFLGAGTILLRRQFVRGLTTAATIWLVAGVGMACGAGLLAEATLVTGLTLLLLTVVRPVERRLFPRQLTQQVRVRVEPASATGEVIRELVAVCEREGIGLESIETRAVRDGEVVEARCRTPARANLLRMLDALRQIAAVRGVRASLLGAATDGATMLPTESAKEAAEALDETEE